MKRDKKPLKREGRPEPGAPRWDMARSSSSPRILIGVALIAVLAVITFPSKTLYSFDLEVGDVASEDVISPIKYPVSKSAEEIEAELLEKRAAVRPIYVYSEEALAAGWREFANLTEDLRRAFDRAAETSSSDYAELSKSLEGRYRVQISPELLRRLARSPELYEAFRDLPLSLQENFQAGVVEDKTLLSTADKVSGILLRRPADELHYAVSYAQLADLASVREQVTLLLGPHLRDAAVGGELAEELVNLPTAEAIHARLKAALPEACLLYTSPSPRDRTRSRMPSSA